MAGPADAGEFRGHWLAYPVAFFLRDRCPGDTPAAIELRTGSETAVVEVSGGTVSVRAGTVPRPALVLTGRPQLIAALFTGQLSAADVTARGLEISGDADLLDRVLPGPEAAYPNRPQPDLALRHPEVNSA